MFVKLASCVQIDMCSQNRPIYVFDIFGCFGLQDVPLNELKNGVKYCVIITPTTIMFFLQAVCHNLIILLQR